MLKSLLTNGMSRRLDNQFARDDFVAAQLSRIAPGSSILDAGCGSQRYRSQCAHLKYFGQDFGQYKVDEQRMIGTTGIGGTAGYQYGQLDFVGDIWDIDVASDTFDAVLCTEVLEHIPYPIATLEELSRVLKPGGTLILTAPSNCLRHMDPCFYSSGFSDRWYERILPECNLEIQVLQPVGDYYSWLMVEMARTFNAHSWLATLCLAPAFLYFRAKKPTSVSISTLCMGYHVVAVKRKAATA